MCWLLLESDVGGSLVQISEFETLQLLWIIFDSITLEGQSGLEQDVQGWSLRALGHVDVGKMWGNNKQLAI